MEKSERELIGLGLIQDSEVDDVIDYFGVEKILNAIDNIDIVNYLDSFMLGMINDKELVKAIANPKVALESFDNDDICDYLEEKGYTVIDNVDDDGDILTKIKNICREIKPKGYIDKEEAKKVLCGYIDDWYINHF